MRSAVGKVVAVTALMFLGYQSCEAAELRLSHQFPGRTDEWRHQAMVRMAEAVANAGVDLKVTVYPGEQLFKAREQWKAMAEGLLDLSILQLSDNSPVPELGITGLPGLIEDHDRADRIAHSAVAQEINAITEPKGVVILDHYSQAASMGSTGACPVSPQVVNGMAARAPGDLFNKMLEAAGAVPMALPSNAIKPALQSGALDFVVTASQSYLSFGLEKEIKCLVVPGKNGIMTMLISLAMSKKSWDKLSPIQQKALRAAAESIRGFAGAESRKVDTVAADQYRAAGVSISELTPEQHAEWKQLSETTALSIYSSTSPAAAHLLKSVMSIK